MAVCTRPKSPTTSTPFKLGYDLVAREEPEYQAIRRDLIVELWFSINPDGQSIVANWYRQNLGTPYEVSPLPVLYQKYVGHDNNRDGYMLNMLESRVVTKATLDTEPIVFYTQHQTAPFPGRIYLPPFADPISSNMHPLMLRWLSLIGMTIAQYLDDHGLTGSMHQETFDVWYPGYLDNIGNFRHTISFFTETALYRYATPHFYTVDEFPAARQSLGTEMLYSSPWKGGWWRLADACQYMYDADMAVLDLASKYHEQMQYNKYRAARDTIEHFEKEPPFAYEIPRQQHDAPTAAVLIEKLMLQGIEVHQSSQPDAWVILMDQPFAGMVKELFEPQVYPALTQRPYDVTGWTLPYQMGVEVHAVTSPLTKAYRDSLRPVHEITGLAAPFTLDANASYRAVNQILEAKGTVSFNGAEVSASSIDKAKLDSILAENRLRSAGTKAGEKSVKAARIGLYRPWVASIDEGWTRWILEQYKFPFRSLYNADILAGRLRDHFDVIVLPDVAERQILEGHRPGTIPDRYVGGLGEEGTEALRDFVNEGGTLVAFNNASLYAMNQFKLPVKNALAGLPPAQFFCSGCLLTVHIEDAKNPLTAGLRSNTVVMFERGPAFNTEVRLQGHGAGAVCERAVAADERIPRGPGQARRQGCRALGGVRKRPRDPARLQTAMARPVARGVQILLQRVLSVGLAYCDILKLRGRGAAAISSRTGFSIALRKSGSKGPSVIPPKREGKHNSFRLGSPANTGSLSLATPAGGALSGAKTRWCSTRTFLSVPLPKD